MIDVQCPKCKKTFGLNDEKCRERIILYVHCPHCHENINIQDDMNELVKFKEFLAKRKLNREQQVIL